MRRVSLLNQFVKKPPTSTQKLWRELGVWAQLRHPNVLALYGFARHENFGDSVAFISPVGIESRIVYDIYTRQWYRNGDAAQFLGTHGRALQPEQRVSMV